MKIARKRTLRLGNSLVWAMVAAAAGPALLLGQSESGHRDHASTRPEPESRPALPRDDRVAEPPREPSATDILRELTRRDQGAARPVVPPASPDRVMRSTVAPEAIPSNSIAPPEQRLFPDGYRFVDRTGRLAKEGDGFVFTFESRGTGAPELPLRLLPNRLLEDMEMASEGGAMPIVFVVSGEVTEYRGVNYFLLEKLLVQPDLGNFK